MRRYNGSLNGCMAKLKKEGAISSEDYYPRFSGLRNEREQQVKEVKEKKEAEPRKEVRNEFSLVGERKGELGNKEKHRSERGPAWRQKLASSETCVFSVREGKREKKGKGRERE